MMIYSQHYSRLRKIARSFGFHPQCMKLVEETGEMLAELARVNNPHEDCVATRLRMVEEMADMWIVASQILILLDEGYPSLESGETYEQKFRHFVSDKINRTEIRLTSRYYENNRQEEPNECDATA